MKKVLSILFLFGIMLATFAQDLKILNVQETTEGIGVYPCGDRHEALVQFITSEPFDIAFESSHDNELDITVDSIAGKKTYSIVFITQAPGQDYSGRRLVIKVEGFQDYRMPLPLMDKQKFEYTVSDPYSKLRSPFFLYFEKAQEEFRDGNYQMAKDDYELCRYCPEFSSDSVNIINHITICDSMMQWSDLALQSENFHQYKKAGEYYSKMLRYNSSDYIRSQLFATQQNFLSDCQALDNMGQTYFGQDNYERAQDMYEQIVENGCNDLSMQAATMLTAIRKAKMRRDDHARTLMFAWSPNMVGLSWGNYYQSRSYGWYGSLMANNMAIDLGTMRSYPKGVITNKEVASGSKDPLIFNYEELEANPRGDYQPIDNKLDYEASFSIGCSWHVWEPIFIHFGVGYHGGGFDTFDSTSCYKALEESKNDVAFDFMNENTWTTSFRNDYSKINWFNGAAPEIGIVLKYWRLAAKFTYQYTYWINNNVYEDFLKQNTDNYQIAVGFCW